ncbi:MAG: hypothetical protein NC432_07420 [Roseburia sp.]|nr:hypothetical protein [Roseburia sp.]MCM1096829.1 hypothetical protein [Ruminococcus flavefaciens]
MYAQKDEYIQEASGTIYQLSQEESVRLQCEAREDYYRRQRSVQHRIEELNWQLTQKDRQLIQKDSVIAALQAELARLNQNQADS